MLSDDEATDEQLVHCARCNHAKELHAQWVCPRCMHNRYYIGDRNPARLKATVPGVLLMLLGLGNLALNAGVVGFAVWMGAAFFEVFTVWTAAALVAGAVSVWGGNQYRRLEDRWAGIVGALAASLPCSLTAILGVPLLIAFGVLQLDKELAKYFRSRT